MHRLSHPKIHPIGRRGALPASVMLLMLSTACTPVAPSNEIAPRIMVSNDAVVGYLDLMSKLAGGDPAQQADIFFAVERDYTSAPTTANSLRYAVALLTPGHPAANLQKGKLTLQTLLVSPERLSSSERTLAAVLLNEAETRLRLEADNSRLVATLDGRARTQANSERRVQAMAEENARLRKSLEEAQQKLDKIRDIERSIIERTPTPPGGTSSPGNRDSLSETQSAPSSR